MSAREPGQHRRDLRKYTEKGALQRSHRKGCGKAAAVVVLVCVSAPVMAVAAGWQLAAVLAGGAA